MGKRLDNLAKEEGLSISDVIRLALKKALEPHSTSFFAYKSDLKKSHKESHKGELKMPESIQLINHSLDNNLVCEKLLFRQCFFDNLLRQVKVRFFKTNKPDFQQKSECVLFTQIELLRAIFDAFKRAFSNSNRDCFC